jgi:hypothetical protein
VKARLLGALAALLLFPAASLSWAAVAGEGDLITTFDGALRPRTLPRAQPAPVTVRVGGDVRSASGDVDSVPQLRRISVAINKQGKLFDRGLPRCRPRDVRTATSADALAECGTSLIGSGHVTVLTRIPDQLPFLVRAQLLAFNGPREDGQRLILAQAYAPNPPGSFILTFRVSKQAGTFGTVLTTTLPEGARKWAYLTHFDMELHRNYEYGGRRRSYVSASCSAPKGFNRAIFPFAKATYTFASGQRLKMSEAAVCRVARGSR